MYLLSITFLNPFYLLASSPHNNYFLTLTTKQRNSPFILSDEDDPGIFGSVTFTPPVIGASPNRKNPLTPSRPRTGSTASSASPGSSSSAARRRFSLPSKVPPSSPQTTQNKKPPVSSLHAVIAAKRLARKAREKIQNVPQDDRTPSKIETTPNAQDEIFSSVRSLDRSSIGNPSKGSQDRTSLSEIELSVVSEDDGDLAVQQSRAEALAIARFRAKLEMINSALSGQQRKNPPSSDSFVSRQSVLDPIPEEDSKSESAKTPPQTPKQEQRDESELARAERLRQRFASRRKAARQRLASGTSIPEIGEDEEEEEVSTLHSEDDLCPEISGREDVLQALWRSRLEAEAVLDRGFWQSEKASRLARLQAWEILQAARTDALSILGLPDDSDLPQPPVWAFLGLDGEDFEVQAAAFAGASDLNEGRDTNGSPSEGPDVSAAVPVDSANTTPAGETAAEPGTEAAVEMPELSRCGKFLRCLFRTVPLLARIGAPLVPGGTGVVVAVDAVAEEGSRGFVYLELQEGLNRLVKLLDDVRFVFNTAQLSDENFKQLLINNLIQPLGKLLLHFDLSVSLSKGVKLSTVEKMLDIKALRKVNKRLMSLVEAELVITSQNWSEIYRKTHMTFLRILDLIKYALEQHPVGGCFGGCCLSVVSRRRRSQPPPPQKTSAATTTTQ